MGYTHYTYHTEPFTDAEWDHVVSGFGKLVEQAISEGIRLSADNGETELSNHERMNSAWHRMRSHGPALMINGMGEDAHETFVVNKKGNPDWGSTTISNGFDCCKTRHKPYDTLVTAALSWIEHHYPGRLNPSSDGEAGDWQAGIDLAHRVFPDEQIACPLPSYDED